MQLSSAGAATTYVSPRDIYNILLDRESERFHGRFSEADMLRQFLKRLGVTIDDESKEWRSSDGRWGRRPDYVDDRWKAGATEPAARGPRPGA